MGTERHTVGGRRMDKQERNGEAGVKEVGLTQVIRGVTLLPLLSCLLYLLNPNSNLQAKFLSSVTHH